MKLSRGCGAAQEYYANTGALKNAAETAQGGKKVGCSIVETFSKSTKPRELEEVLRLEYRSKLLNPKWAQVCAPVKTPDPEHLWKIVYRTPGWAQVYTPTSRLRLWQTADS